MANETNIDYTAFRHVDLAKHWREAMPVQEQARLTERHESHLETALQMPMYKNLPTGGFEYNWKQFRNHDGLFVVRVKGSGQSKHCINKHVKRLSPEEMDAFCAKIFDKATQFLGNLSKLGVEDFWAKVAQEFGIKLQQGTVETLAFWDWAMKIVAARIVYGQKDGQEEFQSLSAPDIAGDIDMTDQTDASEADLKSFSITAQAVDKFLAVGVSKYGAIPKKLKAITRHHNFIHPTKPRPNKPSKKGSALAKATENAQVHRSHLQAKLTANAGNKIRLRRSEFGSHVGAGGPAWWGSINSPQTSKEIRSHGCLPTELQQQEVTAQGGSGQAGTLDDLVIGIHGTTIDDGTKAPQVLTNLAIRTVNPLKRRHSDNEGGEDSTGYGKPLAKMQKVSENHVETLASPSQLDGALARYPAMPGNTT